MFEIRSATVADVPALRDIALRTWPIAYGSILSAGQIAYMLELMYSEEALSRQMKTGHGFLLAEENGTGSGLADAETGYSGQRITRLHKLYVLPSFQRRGVGLALLKTVEDIARNASSFAVELNVNKYNPARKFYEQHGYTLKREEVIDIGAGYVMDDFVLWKTMQGSR